MPIDSSVLIASRTAFSTSASSPFAKYSFGMPIVSPLMSFDNAAVKSGSGTSAEVESIGSCPPMTFIKTAASSAVLVIGPIWSNEEANATSPNRDTRP